MRIEPSPSLVPDSDLAANVFDAMPMPVFVVDREFNVVDFNLARAQLLDRIPFAVLRLREAAQQQCVHSIETADCASAQACRECVVYNFVRQVADEPKACRKAALLRLNAEGQDADVAFLVTIAPIPGEAEPLSLLILDEATTLPTALASFFPDSKGPGKVLVHKMDSN